MVKKLKLPERLMPPLPKVTDPDYEQKKAEYPAKLEEAKDLYRKEKKMKGAVKYNKKNRMKKLRQRYPVDVDRPTTVKRRLFAYEYLNNGFDHAEAYKKSHNSKANDKKAKSEGIRLLSVPKVWNEINRALESIGITKLMTKEAVLSKTIDLYNTCDKESTKVEMIKVWAQSTGLVKNDNNMNIAIMDSNKLAEELMAKRRVDIENMKRCG